jgi:hypothetical protein
MKTLIIHPEDSSTTFLEPVYSTVIDKTIIKGGITRAVLMELIRSHNRIMMMGHGSPWGLLSVGRFPGAGMYIIDCEVAPLLKEKSNNIYIWCYADLFVEENNLEGFYSGMFISEVREASAMGLKNVNQHLVDQSNFIFSNIASNFINENANVLYNNVRREYGMIIRENQVAQYNYERLYFYTHPRIKQI